MLPVFCAVWHSYAESLLADDLPRLLQPAVAVDLEQQRRGLHQEGVTAKREPESNISFCENIICCPTHFPFAACTFSAAQSSQLPTLVTSALEGSHTTFSSSACAASISGSFTAVLRQFYGVSSLTQQVLPHLLVGRLLGVDEVGPGGAALQGAKVNILRNNTLELHKCCIRNQ